MLTDRQGRGLDVARGAGAEVLVASSPETGAWLTGYAGRIDTGPSPFALPPLCVLDAAQGAVLVVQEGEARAAAAAGCQVVTYPGYRLTGPIEPAAAAAEAVRRLAGRRRAAVEPGRLPAAVAAGLDWIDAAARLGAERAVKDGDELVRIRAALAVVDAGQLAARGQARPGLSELDAWAAIRAAMETAAGATVPVVADVVSEPTAARIGGPATGRIMAEGEVLLVDLAPRVSGYWGDSCVSLGVGEIDAGRRRRHARLRTALERALAALRPGVMSAAVDAAARSGLTYGHHTGHGIGTGYFESPRIVPGGEEVLREGMVVALEPADYDETSGMRIEVVARVTADGCEVLSGYSLEP